eukprot:3039137-Lingulodinium_polyedra.AAC.1
MSDCRDSQDAMIQAQCRVFSEGPQTGTHRCNVRVYRLTGCSGQATDLKTSHHEMAKYDHHLPG